MCRFLVFELKVPSPMIVLLDSYGECHLARLASSMSLAVGSEMHGPRAAMGLHFLVEAHSGRRVSVEFQALRVARAELPAQTPVQPVLAGRAVVEHLLHRSEAAP
jgi:hypothetical protein